MASCSNSEAWGWVDRDRRLPFTPQTLFPVCSITKQFTCALLLDQVGDPAVLDRALAARLPHLAQPPTVRDLCHNQSGLRDYWALAMLCGAPVEGVFGPADADAAVRWGPVAAFHAGNPVLLFQRQFPPARRSGRGACRPTSSPNLLRHRVLDVAGMPTARIAPDTAALPGTGYEGSVEAGFVPAVNRIHWTGDAGLIASLEDMIAWERFIDHTRDEPDSLYHRLTGPVTFRDGAPARYGFGLNRLDFDGRTGTGHGGGLRGWRSERCYLPAERLSIVVLFNHMADARPALLDLLDAATGSRRPPATVAPPDPSWTGTFREPETGLVVRLEPAPDGRVRLHYARNELLDPVDGGLRGAGTVLSRVGDDIWMQRATDNVRSRLEPVTGEPQRDVEGRFRSAEPESTLVIESVGGVLYGTFEGWLGQGVPQALLPAGPDLWRLPCPRALDFAPPGDWTLSIHRDDHGAVSGMEVGCWLARRMVFAKT